VDRARELIQSATEEFIFIRDSNIIRRLKLEDILFTEAIGDNVKLHTPQKFFAIHTTLKLWWIDFPLEIYPRSQVLYCGSKQALERSKLFLSNLLIDSFICLLS
jgi:hypothetical protein